MCKTTYTVLCLDDNISELSESLTSLQEALGATMFFPATKQQAEEIAQNETVDLFILDIELSKQDGTGIGFAQQLRTDARYAQTPILFISMYSHYSRYLLSSIPYSAFLSKPFSAATLIDKAGVMLGIPRYLENAYHHAVLTVPVAHGGFVEMDSKTVSSIELIRGELLIRYIDGRVLTFRSHHGCFKTLLAEIERCRATHLRQIYRSVIINVDQIKRIDTQKNVGAVWLFHDDQPKPLGNRYRDRLREFL